MKNLKLIKSRSLRTCTPFSSEHIFVGTYVFTCCRSASTFLCPCHSVILLQMHASRTVLDVFYGLCTAYFSSECFNPNRLISITQSGSSVVLPLILLSSCSCQACKDIPPPISKVVSRSSVYCPLSSRPLHQMLQLNLRSSP